MRQLCRKRIEIQNEFMVGLILRGFQEGFRVRVSGFRFSKAMLDAARWRLTVPNRHPAPAGYCPQKLKTALFIVTAPVLSRLAQAQLIACRQVA